MQSTVLVFTAWCMAATAMGQVAAPDGLQFGQPLNREHGVLLLRNGQVLTGEIAKIGDRYSIAVERGEIRLHQRDIEWVCRDLEEAYRQKCLQSRADCVQDHLDLAQWCQTNGLLAHASEELRIAVALNPNHPLIPLIDRKIRMTAEQKEATPAQPLAAEGNRQPSVDELDRMVRGMPNGAMEMFTQSIQPMLTNTCTASGCHGPNAEDSFRLLRIPSGRPPSRRLTQRNLYTLAQFINWEDPSNSLLLTAPIKPHGSSPTAVFTDRQVQQYQELVRWVYLVALGKKIEPERPKDVIAATHVEGRLPRPAVTPASHELPLGEAKPLPQGRGLPPAAGRTPMDAFDPQAFNRRFATQPPAPPDEEANPSPQDRGVLPATGQVPVDAMDPDAFNSRFAPQSPAPSQRDQ